MVEQLKIRCKEIIALCDEIISLNKSPNVPVIKIIKREFESMQDSLLKEEKVIVLTKHKDLWACRTITDSAYFEYDSNLFDKVFEFEKVCKKLPEKNLTIEYK